MSELPRAPHTYKKVSLRVRDPIWEGPHHILVYNNNIIGKGSFTKRVKDLTFEIELVKDLNLAKWSLAIFFIEPLLAWETYKKVSFFLGKMVLVASIKLKIKFKFFIQDMVFMGIGNILVYVTFSKFFKEVPKPISNPSHPPYKALLGVVVRNCQL